MVCIAVDYKTLIIVVVLVGFVIIGLVYVLVSELVGRLVRLRQRPEVIKDS